MRERTIVLSGFSKTFSITGWRIGYATADARWMPTMAHFHDLTYVCAPAPLQVGAAAGLSSCRRDFTSSSLPIINRSGAGCSRRAQGRWHGSRQCLRAPTTSWPALNACRAKRLRKKLGICCARPASPPWPDRRSSAKGAAKTCCASALPSRMPSWTKPANGCGSCKNALRRLQISCQILVTIRLRGQPCLQIGLLQTAQLNAAVDVLKCVLQRHV